MEELPLSAVVVVVKTERTIYRPVENVMDFLGDENTDLIRVIGTHTDVLRKEEGFSEQYRNMMVEELGFSPQHIFFTGKGKNPNIIEDFLHRTVLPTPRQLVIPPERLLGVAALASAVRAFNRPIKAAESKIFWAEDFCKQLVEKEGKHEETDEIIIEVQSSLEDDIREAKENIFKAVAEQSVDTQNLVCGKAGLHLSIKLKKFTKHKQDAVMGCRRSSRP